MIHIDFVSGTHGNFLAYAINALDPNNRTDDIFTSHGTSHGTYTRTLADAHHYSLLGQPITSTEIISITFEPSDCLLVSLLSYSRAGDYKFDLKNFHINFRDQLIGTNAEKAIDGITEAYGINVRETNSVPRSILREYFKWDYLDYSKSIVVTKVEKQVYTVPTFTFDFKVLYNFDSFLDLLNRIIQHFSLPYKVDVLWYLELWHKFISKIDAIAWNTNAQQVYHAVLANENMEIDFNVLQESWLNARLEIVYNKEMPFMQEEYFKNTQEIIEYLK